MPSIVSLIARAVSLIASLWSRVQSDAKKIADLESKLFVSSAAAEANKATVDAAAAQQSALADAATSLAAAITDHPDVPLSVDPDTLAHTVDVGASTGVGQTAPVPKAPTGDKVPDSPPVPVEEAPVDNTVPVTPETPGVATPIPTPDQSPEDAAAAVATQSPE